LMAGGLFFAKRRKFIPCETTVLSPWSRPSSFSRFSTHDRLRWFRAHETQEHPVCFRCFRISTQSGQSGFRRRRVCRQISFQMNNQRWKVALDCVPNHIQIHVVIVVDENVSHRREQPPRNLWKKVAAFGGQAAGGFTNNLKLAVDRLVFFLVRLEASKETPPVKRWIDLAASKMSSR